MCRMFYFFFESRRAKTDPVVIWLTGGPGCSSELALFYENGPFKVTNNLSLVWNDYGWDKVHLAQTLTIYNISNQVTFADSRVIFCGRFQTWYMSINQPELVLVIVPAIKTFVTMKLVSVMIFISSCRFVSILLISKVPE